MYAPSKNIKQKSIVRLPTAIVKPITELTAKEKEFLDLVALIFVTKIVRK